MTPEEADDTIRSRAETQDVAKKRINQARVDMQQVSFECLPNPTLEENDDIRVEAPPTEGETR